MNERVDHKIRCRAGGTVEIKGLTRSKAIKLQCTECLGWGEDDPKNCTDKLCPLFPFRGSSQASYRAVKVEDSNKPTKTINPNAHKGLKEYWAKKKSEKLNSTQET